MKNLLFAALAIGASQACANSPILVVDLSEAYSRSTALAGLLADVDRELQDLSARHRPELDRLKGELRKLKEQGANTRDQQLLIAKRISDIETIAELEQDRLSIANQNAIATVNTAIAGVKSTLQKQSQARIVLDIQETHYVRPGCTCFATERLYELLNSTLPRVELRIDEVASSR